MTKIEYQTRNKELININKIENYIYSKSGKVKTYISTYKNRTRHFDCLKFSEHTMVIIEVDQLYYDSLQRIVKIDHFSKSIANQELQLNRDLSMETLIHISTDTFKYDLGQITAVRVPLESSLSETILSQIIYDGRNRVIKESTVWNFNNNSRKDTIEKEFTYEGNKVICLIKRPDLLLTDLTRLNRNEINTDYYNDAGLITQITNLRVRLNLEDHILIKYEFY